MKMPLDIKEVLNAAADTEAARSMPIRVSVFFDLQVPDELLRYVCRAFDTKAPNAYVHLMEYPVGPFVLEPGCDLAVLVAGLSPATGMMAKSIRDAGVPVLTVTTLPKIVKEQAAAAGYPLIEADVIAPAVEVDGLALPADSDFNQEPYPLTVDRLQSLSNRMGDWVVDTFREKRLAFALAFPFVRRPLAMEFVNATSVQNAGIGLVVILPGADLPVMTLNQAKMILQIAAAYDQTLGKERIRELLAVVGGGFACRAVARQLVALAPGWGWAIKAGIGFTGTVAMGYAAIAYFEQLEGEGGMIDDALAMAKLEAARVQDALKSGETPVEGVVAAATTVAGDTANGVVDAAKRVIPNVRSTVVDLCASADVKPAELGKQIVRSLAASGKAE